MEKIIKNNKLKLIFSLISLLAIIYLVYKIQLFAEWSKTAFKSSKYNLENEEGKRLYNNAQQFLFFCIADTLILLLLAAFNILLWRGKFALTAEQREEKRTKKAERLKQKQAKISEDLEKLGK